MFHRQFSRGTTRKCPIDFYVRVQILPELLCTVLCLNQRRYYWLFQTRNTHIGLKRDITLKLGGGGVLLILYQVYYQTQSTWAIFGLVSYRPP